jgi:hypothetical protein
MHLTANQIALVALVLSIVSSIGAVIQWWSSGTDEKIHAAIDLSDRYLDHAVDIAVTKRRAAWGQNSYEDDAGVQMQEARLEYSALLANRGLLNWKYLSQRVACDIVQWADEVGPEAASFSKAHPGVCKTSSQSDAAAETGATSPQSK